MYSSPLAGGVYTSFKFAPTSVQNAPSAKGAKASSRGAVDEGGEEAGVQEPDPSQPSARARFGGAGEVLLSPYSPSITLQPLYHLTAPLLPYSPSITLQPLYYLTAKRPQVNAERSKTKPNQCGTKQNDSTSMQNAAKREPSIESSSEPSIESPIESPGNPFD